MKRSALIFTFLLVFSSMNLTQEIIENQEKPLSKNASRVIKLQEVFRIKDESGNFYFKSIESYGNLKVAPDGTFLISEENQLLKFSPQGKFVKNLLRTGQGPSEMSSIFTTVPPEKLSTLIWMGT
jgi:hypothetical protein